jgi:uncharacterized protein
VSPGARHNEIIGRHGDELRVRVAARAVEGRANREIIAFLAQHLDVSASRVTLLRGRTSRHKVIDIEGMTENEALYRLLPR